ncbi:SURF1 family protein [Ornithinimicrobium cryptoxanthini]|uniref:SURF1 family protein n=1 Tax=Ornithinimicrobium cryptoxanthini TaxID=2934161 RepID=UPI0021187280|nr:SURF1 family protein [Ornithinimicrobium cryptoxanthini]
MLRTFFTPRWLGLLAVVAAVCVGFGWLGAWQLSVAQHDVVARIQAEREALVEAPLQEVLAPHSAFTESAAAHPVVVEGEYDGAHQFLVPGRVLDGEPGFWVVTPLLVDGGEAVIEVMRGFVTTPDQADVPPTQPVTVRGELAPGESPYFGQDPLPEGQRGTIDLSSLANERPEQFYNGFIFATSEEPQLTSATVEPVPPPVLTVGEIDWRNLGYALQWWVFAAFAVFMYVKMLRDAAQNDATQDEAAENDAAQDEVTPTPSGPAPTVSSAPADERIEPHHV